MIEVDATSDIFFIILIIERRTAMCPHAPRECKLQLACLKFRAEKRIAQAEKILSESADILSGTPKFQCDVFARHSLVRKDAALRAVMPQLCAYVFRQ